MPVDKKKSICIFCGEPASPTRALIQSSSGYCICSECVERCADIVKQKKHMLSKGDPDYIDLENIPTPHEIAAHLDQYVIGQEDAKKVLSVAVYNTISV